MVVREYRVALNGGDWLRLMIFLYWVLFIPFFVL